MGRCWQREELVQRREQGCLDNGHEARGYSKGWRDRRGCHGSSRARVGKDLGLPPECDD